MFHDIEADFIRQEIEGCLDEFANEVSAPGYLSLLDKPFLRLTDEIIIEIIRLISQHCKRPKVREYELVYDALHYFLTKGTFFETQFASAYIQDNWAGCRREYVSRLNFLRKIGVLSSESRPFRKIPKSKSIKMKGKSLRWLELAEGWADKIRLIRRKGKILPVKPYGFQKHVRAIYDVLETEGKRLLLAMLPRDLGAKLRHRKPLPGSTQPMDCGLNIMPYVLNARNNVRPYRLLAYGAREG